MINVAFLNSAGEIQQWCSPGDDNQWPDGSMMGDLTVKHMDVTIDLAEFGKTHIWGFVEQAWVLRDERPNIFYDWVNGAWEFQEDRLAEEIRLRRNAKLYACDWTQLPDAPITNLAEWNTYRQALRDVPQNNIGVTSLEDVVWPTPP